MELRFYDKLMLPINTNGEIKWVKYILFIVKIVQIQKT
jgi:hypothetical protein